MATPVMMPQMGESIAEGTIVRWIKKVGDTVDRDEPLFEISTDKVDAEIPSPASGVLLQIKVNEGETVPVDSIVGVIGTAGETLAAGETVAAGDAVEAVAPAAAVRQSPPSGPVPIPYPASRPVASRSGGTLDDLRRRKSSPVVRRIAHDHNVNIEALSGSGIGGRVTKRDILGYLDRIETPALARPGTPGPRSARRRSSARRPRRGRGRRRAARRRDVAGLPQERVVDDRELEALAAVDRQHLHRLGVGLQPAAALLVAVSCSASAIRRRSQAVSAVVPSCSAVAAACSSWPTWRRSVSRRSPSARAQHPPGQALGSVIVSVSDATPARAARRAQRCSRRWTSSQSSSSRGRDPLGGPAEERRQRGGARPRRARSGARAPRAAAASRARGVGAEHAAGAVDDRRDADRVERVADERGVAVGAHEHRDVAGRTRSRPSVRRPRRDARSRAGRAARRGRRRGPRRCARAPTALRGVAAAA